ncbi:hypothetical protein DPMN_044100 [Dreissena polymorpha]|uniref:Uncharacterized protein n=1 Tax=Dreissena polymorpha TaxID=45954 RepID=A0A9D4D2C2_DREPO|nr:hypothetical protein DPMN_044100 [Dreissena polymorpha]
MDISCSGCSQHSHDCVSVSARMYCALCSQPSHYCHSVSAWVYRVLGVHSQVITAFLCQHGFIVLWVFPTKSLLPFCVSMDVLCSGCLQPSHYRRSLSAWMYRALGIHNQVIIAFFFSNIAKSPFYYDILAAERTIWGSP